MPSLVQSLHILQCGGMSAIEKVATVFSPLILIVAVIAGVVFIAQAGGVGPFLNEAGKLGGMGLGDGITIVVGSWIAGAIMGVDMFRFNKSVKAVWLCAAACFVMTNPILNFVRLHRRRSQWGVQLRVLDAGSRDRFGDSGRRRMDDGSVDHG